MNTINDRQPSDAKPSISEQVQRDLRDAEYAAARRERSRRQTLMIFTVIIFVGVVSVLPFVILGRSQRKKLPVREHDRRKLLTVSRIHPKLQLFNRQESVNKYERLDGAIVVRYRCRGRTAVKRQVEIDTTFEYYGSATDAEAGFEAGVKHLRNRFGDSLDQEINYSTGANQEFLAEMKPLSGGEAGIVGCMRINDSVITFRICPEVRSGYQYLKDYVESMILVPGAF